MVDEQQRLVDTLKFSPRNIRIGFFGYGGEIVMGTISKEAYDYWSERLSEELADFAVGNSAPDSLPEAAKFAEPGAWYECDDLAHHYGVELGDHGRLVVVDAENGETLFETHSLDPADLDDHGILTELVNEYYASQQPVNSYCFFGQSTEKGLFFETEFEIQRPFDPSLLHIYYHDIEGLPVFSHMAYDGQSVEDPGNCDTTGKGMHFAVMSSSE